MRLRPSLIVALLFTFGCSSSEDSSSNPVNDSGTAFDASDGATSDAGNDDASDAGTQPDDLAAVLEPIRADANLPALIGAVWQGEQLIAIGVTGTRKLGDPTPATIHDQWHLGSDTKAMTATLIGIHVDKGDIHLDDTIGELFAGETIDPGYVNVTIAELLQHRGGAPGDMPADIWQAMWAGGSNPAARTAAVMSLISRAPEQAIGTFVYSNAGYMIAGAAVERIQQGKPWEEIIQDELFAPLGMGSCGFGAPGTPDQVDQPWGHDVETPVSPGPLADNPPSLGPAGTVRCSMTDWGKFLAIHLHGARNEAVPIVSQATLTALQTPPAGADYACGWGVTDRDWAGGTTLTHSGSNTMWFATTWIAPAKNTTLAVITNRGDDPAALAVDTAFGPLIETYIP
jgi:D-alanyl-D-alanine carboxypeptidase